jgi:hypothetical protein
MGLCVFRPRYIPRNISPNITVIGRAKIAHTRVSIKFPVSDASGSPMHKDHTMVISMLTINHSRRLSRVRYCIMVERISMLELV